MAKKDVGECCVLVGRVVPVLFILAIIGWSYYAYVVHVCLDTVTNLPETVVYLVFYHLLLLLLLWCFFAVMLTPTAQVPPQFFLTQSELQRYQLEMNDDSQKFLLLEKSKSLPIHCRTGTRDIRFCEECKAIKPDRAHHCSTCKRCILKMDHHCVWVNNCVCFSNYKFFVLLIGYSCLFSAFVAATSFQYFIQFWVNANSPAARISDLNTLFLFIISLVVAISLATLLAYHIHLVRLNRSTMEHSYITPVFVNGPDKFGFNHGGYANFVDVFGERKACWFLPIFTGGGDGVTFARNLLSDSMTNKYQSMETSRVSLGSCHSIRTSTQFVQPPSPTHSQTGDTSSLLAHEILPAANSRGVGQITPIKQQNWM
jgi:hypothetical protein